MMLRTSMPTLFAIGMFVSFSFFPVFATQASDLVVVEPWARASIGVSRPAAAYLSIRNEGIAADVLTDIKTPAANLAEIHKSEVKDGLARMSPSGPVEVLAGSTVHLEPGGLHIMLMKLKRPLKKGDTISMTLFFENSGAVEVTVPVYGIGASRPVSQE